MLIPKPIPRNPPSVLDLFVSNSSFGSLAVLPMVPKRGDWSAGRIVGELRARSPDAPRWPRLSPTTTSEGVSWEVRRRAAGGGSSAAVRLAPSTTGEFEPQIHGEQVSPVHASAKRAPCTVLP